MRWTAWLALAAATVATGQSTPPPRRDLLANPKPLTRAQIEQVLGGTRQALAGKAFRWTTVRDEQRGDPGATEVVMGANGRPTFIRIKMSYQAGIVYGTASGAAPPSRSWTVDAVHITEFTGRPARSCNGTTLAGELILAYQNEGSGWTASANTRPYPGYPSEVFDLLAGVLPADSGDVERIGDRTARALVVPWTPAPDARSQPEVLIGDPLPNVRRDTSPIANAGFLLLWIDVDSLLPLRWERFFAADAARGIPAKPDYAFSFRYDPALTISRPDGVALPDCVQ